MTEKQKQDLEQELFAAWKSKGKNAYAAGLLHGIEFTLTRCGYFADFDPLAEDDENPFTITERRNDD